METEDSKPPVDWPIEAVVEQLREIRQQSLADRNRLRNPTVLPSRSVLARIVESFGSALFPNRLGSRQLTSESVDYFVGQVIDSSLNELADQVAIELQFASESRRPLKEVRHRTNKIVRCFALEIPAIRKSLDSDLSIAFAVDPSARSVDEILACFPGIFAILHYRIANKLWEEGAPLVARIIAGIAHSKTGIDIHPGARIGDEFFIDHGTGVDIGETAVVGNRVRLSHAVTLGARCVATLQKSKCLVGDRRHPLVEDDVVVYAGATLLGPICVGRRSVIGGNVWITEDVPDESVVSRAKSHRDG